MKRIKAICLSVFMILGLSIGIVHAEEINPDLPVSLTFTVHDPQGDPLGGGSLTVTKIASITFYENGNPYFKILPEFEGAGIDLDKLGDPEHLTREHNANLIDYIEDYATDHGLLGTEINVPASGPNAGIVTFSDANGDPLTQGLYLVVQETPHPGYEKMPAFLISLPQAVYDSEDEFVKYEYNVNANSKSDPQKIPETPHRPQPPTSTQTGAVQYMGSMLISGIFLFLVGVQCIRLRKAEQGEQ